jgi:hypothetical protein
MASSTPRPETVGAGATFCVQIPASQTSPPTQSVVSSQGAPSIPGVFVGVLVGALVGVMVAVLVAVPVGVTVGVTHSHSGATSRAIGALAPEVMISVHTKPGGHVPPHSGAVAKPQATGQFTAVQDVLSP